MVRIDKKQTSSKLPFKRILHYIYLFKFFSISIIIFLKNNLSNILSNKPELK